MCVCVCVFDAGKSYQTLDVMNKSPELRENTYILYRLCVSIASFKDACLVVVKVDHPNNIFVTAVMKKSSVNWVNIKASSCNT